MRVLITGITGFVGRHLAQYLLAQGVEVAGIGRPVHDDSMPFSDHDRVPIHHVEIADVEVLARIVESSRPEAIVHLAAFSQVGLSWDAPSAVINTNVLGTLALLNAVWETGFKPLILSVGSGEEYGLVREDEIPISEATPLRPLNPYAVSKVAQGLLALQYAKKFGLRVIHMRPFNHIGPGQARGFITADFAAQIAHIEQGLAPPLLRVGNLDSRRDYLDVRDVVRAYVLALEGVHPGEVYNVASGVTWSGREILARLLALTSTQVDVVEDPALLRPVDVPVVVGDASKLRSATGWKPECSLEKSLADILSHWRIVTEKANAGAAR